MKKFSLFVALLLGMSLINEVGIAEESEAQVRDSYTFQDAVELNIIADDDFRPINQFNAKYPYKALKKGLNGFVLIQYTVGANGKTKDFVILEETPEGVGFGKATIKAVKKYIFTPVLVDGKPVDITEVEARLTFELQR